MSKKLPSERCQLELFLFWQRGWCESGDAEDTGVEERRDSIKKKGQQI